MKASNGLGLTLASIVLILAGQTSQAESEYEKWLKNTRQEYQDYLDANDKAFLGFLKQTWDPVRVKAAVERDAEPKPVDIPIAKPQPKVIKDSTPVVKPLTVIPEVDQDAPDDEENDKTSALPNRPEQPSSTKTPQDVVNKSPARVVQKTPVNPDDAPSSRQKDTPQAVAPDKPPVAIGRPSTATPVTPLLPEKKSSRLPELGATAHFDYFGHDVTVTYDPALASAFRGPVKSDQIAAYWQTLASAKHKETVEQLQKLVTQLKLNDWGSALLFDRFSRAIHKDASSQALTGWFLLVKGGYDARVAYNNQIHLLVATDQMLYGVTYFKMNGKPYYAVKLNARPLKPGKVFTYGGQHELGKKPLTFNRPNDFLAGGETRHRDLSFKFDGKQHQIKVDYPAGYGDYFAQYPQLELSNYFRAGLPSSTATELLDQLRPLVQGKTELEAVNLLLRFVQTAFAYETDDKQFREENYLFPVETLYYPYSDCEDRAAFFGWLTESLLGLDVAILTYPGHVAAAVAFNSNVQGDAWAMNNRRYVVADPTYVNADAGMTMPRYKDTKPKIASF